MTEKAIEFKDWNKGMENHPIYGFGLIKNANIFENKGIAKIQNRLVDSGLVYTALPGAEVYDVYGNTWTLTGGYGSSNGILYKGTISIQTGITDPWDIKIYKDYVFISRSSTLDCYGPISNGPQYFSDVLTGFDADSFGALVVGQDDFLYRASGNAVAKISVTPAGTGVAPTVTTSASLDLPDGQYATCMTEFGSRIAIGTCGAPSYSDRHSLPVARIYTWNRQAGTLGNPGLADLPIVLNESSVNSILSHANQLYISAGTKGNIYLSDGASYRHIVSLPYLKSNYDIDSTVYSNAMAIHKGKSLLVGLSGSGSSVAKLGVYEIDITDSSYPVCLRETSAGDVGSAGIQIGFVNNKTGNIIRAGWWRLSSYVVDTTDATLYSSYGAVIETPLIKVGAYRQKRTFQGIEFNLSDPLISGQGLRFSYRKDSSSDYTTLNTWTYSDIGAKTTFVGDAPISDCDFIQLKIEMDQGTGVTAGNNVSLISVILW